MINVYDQNWHLALVVPTDSFRMVVAEMIEEGFAANFYGITLVSVDEAIVNTESGPFHLIRADLGEKFALLENNVRIDSVIAPDLRAACMYWGEKMGISDLTISDAAHSVNIGPFTVVTVRK